MTNKIRSSKVTKKIKPLVIPVSTALLALSVAYFYGKTKGGTNIFVAENNDGDLTFAITSPKIR